METTSNYMLEIDRIKEALNLNDVQIASRIGVQPHMLSSWRCGRHAISNQNKDKIFAFLSSEEVTNLGFGRGRMIAGYDPLLEYVNGAWPELTAEEKAEVVAVIERAKEKKTAAHAADSLRA